MQNLSEREQAILLLIAQGFSIKQIASKLYLSFHTVATHRKNMARKLNAVNAPHMVFKAINLGVIKFKNSNNKTASIAA